MQQTCDDCGFDASDIGPREVAAALPQLADSIGECLRAIDNATVRRRPAPDVWSPLEYVGHLRESMAFHRWLIEIALAEDEPVVPIVDPDESVAQAGYGHAEPNELMAQFERRIHRLGSTLVALSDAATRRTLTLGSDRVSVAFVARSAWHECHHHLGDIRRMGQLDSGHAHS